jgi:hypothetical protein
VAEKAEVVLPGLPVQQARQEVPEQREEAHLHPTQADVLPPVLDLHAAQTDTTEAAPQSPIVQAEFRPLA